MKAEYGYMGKMLFVDLSNGKTHEEELSDELARDFIGGYGVGARIIMERMKPGIDPLEPGNIFGIGTGPLRASAKIGGTLSLFSRPPAIFWYDIGFGEALCWTDCRLNSPISPCSGRPRARARPTPSPGASFSFFSPILRRITD